MELRRVPAKRSRASELIGHRTLRESIPEESEPQLQKEIDGLSAAIEKAKSDGETEGLDSGSKHAWTRFVCNLGAPTFDHVRRIA